MEIFSRGYKYFYIVECNGYYKVGICVNLKSRMCGFITNNPYNCQKIYSRKSWHAEFIEKQILDKFNDKRIVNRTRFAGTFGTKTEWLKDIDPDDLIQYAQYLYEKVKDVKVDKRGCSVVV